jgi:hypothetical protein
MHNITLSTGRIVVHTPEPNGATLATPTPGPASFTPTEYADYLAQRAANHAEDQPDWNNQL